MWNFFIDSDAQNCGTCGNACPGGQTCLGGSCRTPCGSQHTLTCNSPTFLSDGGVTCGNGQAACPNGATCPCPDFQNDPANCGGCGNNCPSEACQGGQCVLGCPTGQLCEEVGGAGSGVCVPSCQDFLGLPSRPCGIGVLVTCAFTQIDPQNCGACGNACPAGQSCANGVCAASCSSYGPSPLCGSATCGPGQTCSNGNCVPACPSGDVCSDLFGQVCLSSCG